MTDIVICDGSIVIGAAEMIEFKELNKNQKGWCGRIRITKSKIGEIFEKSVVSSKSQKLPFNISVDGKILKNVWIESVNVVYVVGDHIIIDVMHWIAESLK